MFRCLSLFILIALVMASCDKVTMWPAIVTTSQPTRITQESVTLNGQVVKDKFTTVGFEYGNTTDYGTFISTADLPENDKTGIPVSYLLSTLTPNTTYHYRLVAQSASRKAYGEDVSFTTLDNKVIFNPDVTYGTVSDVDGNKYKTIQVGTQTWMAENLKTTSLNDGTAIKLIGPADNWMATPESQTPAFSWLESDEKFKHIFGAYYNWKAVNTSKLCPTGWHVPSDVEWKTFIDYLGGSLNIGTKIRETGGNHWLNGGSATTNSTGFTALPAGYRNFNGAFMNTYGYSVWLAGEAYWWTSTQAYSQGAYFEAIYNNSNALLQGAWSFAQGHSVRCVKN
jgi:uncharacterized protein (TIGR02145 family)